MSRILPAPNERERAALLRFEAAYERWRLAEAALAESEVRLWNATLASASDAKRMQLGAETLALRDGARAARQAVLALLVHRRG
jgi:hypothetical protein